MNTSQILLGIVGLIYLGVASSLCYSGRWPLGMVHVGYAISNLFLIIEAGATK